MRTRTKGLGKVAPIRALYYTPPHAPKRSRVDLEHSRDAQCVVVSVQTGNESGNALASRKVPETWTEAYVRAASAIPLAFTNIMVAICETRNTCHERQSSEEELAVKSLGRLLGSLFCIDRTMEAEKALHGMIQGLRYAQRVTWLMKRAHCSFVLLNDCRDVSP
jgi:hypothetical protein